jgi:hypothetical protein
MRKKITWIVVCLLIFGHTYLQYLLYSLPSTYSSAFHKFLAFFSILLPFMVAAILAILISFIPIRKKSYDDKFSLILPFTILGTLLLSTAVYSYQMYLYKEHYSGPLYESIVIDPKLNCESVKNGKFQTGDGLLIEREGEWQIQTSKRSKFPDKFKVEWLNDCEYTLSPENNPVSKLKVKIISVNKDGYVCYVAIDNGKTSKHIVKRVK